MICSSVPFHWDTEDCAALKLHERNRSMKLTKTWVPCELLSRNSRNWARFRKPQPLQPVSKVRQYTSNLYGSTPPICIAPCFPGFQDSKKKGKPCGTPPICTAVRPPFVLQYFWRNTGGWGHRNKHSLLRTLLRTLSLLKTLAGAF